MRDLTEEEREIYPPPAEMIREIFVDSGWGQKGGFQIKGYSRKESLEIIEEALLAEAAYSGRGAGRSVHKVVFSPIALSWAREE